MTDQRISTEEAERIAAAQEHSVRSGRKPTPELRLDTAAALRSLAAERDWLRETLRNGAVAGGYQPVAIYPAPTQPPPREENHNITTGEIWKANLALSEAGNERQAHQRQIQDLADEVERLREALGEALDTSGGCPVEPPCGNCKFCRAFSVYVGTVEERQR